MRSLEAEAWESSYWDDFLAEFGVEAYINARYQNAYIEGTKLA